jgi:hypothetical protein
MGLTLAWDTARYDGSILRTAQAYGATLSDHSFDRLRELWDGNGSLHWPCIICRMSTILPAYTDLSDRNIRKAEC